MVEPTHLKNISQIGSFPSLGGKHKKKYLKRPRYCWSFRNPANQFRLVVYPIICRVLYIQPVVAWDFCSSTVSSKCRILMNSLWLVQSGTCSQFPFKKKVTSIGRQTASGCLICLIQPGVIKRYQLKRCSFIFLRAKHWKLRTVAFAFFDPL